MADITQSNGYKKISDAFAGALGISGEQLHQATLDALNVSQDDSARYSYCDRHVQPPASEGLRRAPVKPKQSVEPPSFRSPSSKGSSTYYDRPIKTLPTERTRISEDSTALGQAEVGRPRPPRAEGYWFDPDDKAGFVNLRINGKYKRTSFAKAQEQGLIPGSANPDNITVYSEKQGKVIKDRGTQGHEKEK